MRDRWHTRQRGGWHGFRLLGLGLLLLLGSAVAAASGGRALVIGNAKYERERPLVNTLNDARDVAAKLTALGFAVTQVQDLDGRALRLEVNRFLDALRAAVEPAVIFYSGHGLQDSDRDSYLLPVDARIEREADIKSEGVSVNAILAELERRPKGAMSLVVLDACRDNPYAASRGGKGLGRVTANGGTLVLYAASPNQTAADNPRGRNGLFTQHLLAVLDRPGLDIEDGFDEVALNVDRDSNGSQVPYKEGNLLGKHYLAPPAAVGYLQVNVDAPGARVWVDGREVGRAGPGEPLNLSNLPVGTVRVEASAPGRQRVQQQVALQSGAWTPISLILPGAAPAAPPAPPQAPVTAGTWTEPKTGMVFVPIPAGRFQMGCGGAWAGECEDDEKPARQVQVKGYWLATTEVTQAQWQAVMGSNRSEFKDCADCPVEQVSWDDAQAFIAKLDPGGQQGLRLPTEAEWEYACREGGKEETYCGGKDLDRLAWYNQNSGQKTHPVGGKTANGLGLYDMSGNVTEWTCSAYVNPYNGAEQRCVDNNDATSARVVRGGAWYYIPRLSRAADRKYDESNVFSSTSGLRLARTLSP